MSSGIYKLTFSSGHYYIGKSKDIDRRWKEHATKLEKGTAAKNMQACYNSYGMPNAEVLLEVHPDHLDVLEPILINNYWGPNILNTTREAGDEDLLEEHLLACKFSLATIITCMLNHRADAEKATSELARVKKEHKQQLKRIKEGTELEKVEAQSAAYLHLLQTRDKELTALKSRGFFSRLFNL